MSYEEPSGPELIIQHTGQIFSLGAEPITIGNHQDNVIVLADPQVSPHHAVISWQAETGVFTVEDVGSKEGTFLNEVPIKEPQILRHGDVLRMGNTVMDLRLKPSPEAGIAPLPVVEASEKSARSPVLTGILIALLVGACIVCVILFATVVLTGGTGTPDVIIQSPAAGAQIGVGNEIILQATASGAKDLTLLELNVDGSLVATATDPEGISSLTVRKAWRFTAPGEHIISADAYTASGKTSRPASVKVTVVGAPAQATATSSPEPEEPTETPTPTETATAVPEDTATPIPTTVPPPQVEYFQSSPSTINVGGCATLQWGRVTNATEASIEPDVGGVGTPGSERVCPLETTTYFLTATGPGGTTQAATTVTVIGALPDLTIESITFDPSPAAVGQETKVQITIQNIGAGAAGAFNWEWEAGPQDIFDGRVFGLNAGDSTVVTVNWTPGEPNDSLTTEARVDTAGEVDETDVGNNTYTASIQVIELPSQPETVTLKSEGALDGYWLNDGSGSSSEDILVRLTAFMIQHGVAVEAFNQISLLPADLVADHIVELMETDLPDEVGTVFNITADDYYGLMDVTRLLSERHGYHFEYHDIPSFSAQVNRLAGPGDPLYPLVDFLTRSASKITAMRDKRYDNTQYRRARSLAKVRLNEPALGKTVDDLLRFVRSEGLISEAETETRCSA